MGDSTSSSDTASAQVVDLMAMLEKSVQEAKATRGEPATVHPMPATKKPTAEKASAKKTSSTVAGARSTTAAKTAKKTPSKRPPSKRLNQQPALRGPTRPRPRCTCCGRPPPRRTPTVGGRRRSPGR
ncbi:hypothetical protein [Streptomyces sp. NRRL F-2664]|uniref:hypothetical protein n=1 Tax=Streptomyces sp. NRRL F-2664 TaxID=1463842 RepID=UPI00131CEF00|nr:hypothetical protein [Streptomyces sp. NRRL F-2664]